MYVSETNVWKGRIVKRGFTNNIVNDNSFHFSLNAPPVKFPNYIDQRVFSNTFLHSSRESLASRHTLKETVVVRKFLTDATNGKQRSSRVGLGRKQDEIFAARPGKRKGSAAFQRETEKETKRNRERTIHSGLESSVG